MAVAEVASATTAESEAILSAGDCFVGPPSASLLAMTQKDRAQKLPRLIDWSV